MTTPSSSSGGSTAAATNPAEGGVETSINPELWQACAGPLVNLSAPGTHVVYFPQGHSEQVAASMKKDVDSQIPNYPNLPSKLICLLHNVTLHADPDTDEVYAQMTLQPVPSFGKDDLLRSDLSMRSNKPQTEFFCKTLTASDTSTHGGFSVPRRAAEKIFPPLDFSMQPPVQELVASDLHDIVWTFRHIYRGKPSRHLLTTGWSLFVSRKRLFAGDSVLFIRDEKQQLLLGIRRANRQPTNLSLSVLSSDSMHIGVLGAAAHAAANNSPFTVFYNPRASPSEFVIPLAKYFKAVYNNQISLGMRFRMMFEIEESGTRRYMGTITGISDLDPVRWKNSQWRNLQVGWDEPNAGDRRTRVSIWEIEPVIAPFFICPPPFFRSKRPRQPGLPENDPSDFDNLFKRTMPWIGDDFCMKDRQGLSGLSLVQRMNMPQNPSVGGPVQKNCMQSLPGSVLPNLCAADISRQLSLPAPQLVQSNNLQLNTQRTPQQVQQLDQLLKFSSPLNPLNSTMQLNQTMADITQQSRQNLLNQTLSTNQFEAQILQPQNLVQTTDMLQQSLNIQNQPSINLPQNLLLQKQQQQPNELQHIMGQHQQQSSVPDQSNPHLQVPENQIQLELLQKLQQQQQTLLAQQSVLQQPVQLAQLRDHQSQHTSQGFSRFLSSNQLLEMPQTVPTSLPQSNMLDSLSQQQVKFNSQRNARMPHPLQHSKFQQQPPDILCEIQGHTGLAPNANANQLSVAGSSVLTAVPGVSQSGITDDILSCSTSTSTNNCGNVPQVMMNSWAHRSTGMQGDMAQSVGLLSSDSLDTIPLHNNLVKDLHHKSDFTPSSNISTDQNHGIVAPQSYYLNGAAVQTDYLDTSSSTTSVCLSQNDVHLHQSNNSFSYNPQMWRDASQDGELQADTMNDLLYGTNIDSQVGLPMNSNHLLTKGMPCLGKDFSNNFSSGGVLPNSETSKDHQQELSSSMVSQSFGVPDMTFNSIDSAINDSGFFNRGSRAPPTQFPRMRTYTKVYKRGAVGRSIDITSYSNYEDLKQDLACRFGIEGQLEDRGRVGWKLVYVDHENDVLLLGDDPWKEFVKCVRCIKILSPQEVRQISLDDDFWNSAPPYHTGNSSSNAGNA